MVRPVPVTELMPLVHEGGALGKQSETVFAYDTEWGWVRAVYYENDAYYGGGQFWEFSHEGVTGYEWELDRLEHVTHWLVDLPSPDRWDAGE